MSDLQSSRAKFVDAYIAFEYRLITTRKHIDESKWLNHRSIYMGFDNAILEIDAQYKVTREDSQFLAEFKASLNANTLKLCTNSIVEAIARLNKDADDAAVAKFLQ